MALPAQFAATLLDKDWYTEDEYFAWDERSQERWEWVPINSRDSAGRRLGHIRCLSDGYIMTSRTGSTADHSGIIVSLLTGLKTALPGRGTPVYRIFGPDLKIHAADGRSTYPDVSLFGNPPSFYSGRRDIVSDPLIIAEVLSPLTESADRGEKWASYQTIPTLQHYLLLAADKPRVELYTRQENGWLLETFEGLENHLSLSALSVTLAMADLYAQVEFDAEP